LIVEGGDEWLENLDGPIAVDKGFAILVESVFYLADGE
jgi:hypothetical protein